ncbi:NADPH-dependent F420 reductase [Blastococcus sp. PRF04-17]|uniref:NADPH-dependent F420 reductase n=1 Tax=Blastococcus sp. PRF04-17 TaxID=2933797 RepID=UPI001FF15EF2|nr:NADPH-dependent F420 reductase [Blastococcus sp. PRF04-17]UOY03184.1 NADPH-dependent F420 reductase [Blastococcus sp. PRF04-17]
MTAVSTRQPVAILGGTGALGRGLAARLAAAGHRVTLGSRDADRATASAAELAESLAPAVDVERLLFGAANAEAAATHDVVILATPWDPSGDSIRELADPLAETVVISAINPLGFDVTGPYGLDVVEGSAAEQVAASLPNSRVAAAFHHLSAPSLLKLSHDLSGEDVLVCADDDRARVTALNLAAAVTGTPGIDVGPLRQARQLEPFTAVLIAVNKRYRTRSGLALRHVDRNRASLPEVALS